jgi:hypothetical protein
MRGRRRWSGGLRVAAEILDEHNDPFLVRVFDGTETVRVRVRLGASWNKAIDCPEAFDADSHRGRLAQGRGHPAHPGLSTARPGHRAPRDGQRRSAGSQGR